MFLRSRDGTGVSYAAGADGMRWMEGGSAQREIEMESCMVYMYRCCCCTSGKQAKWQLLSIHKGEIRLFARYWRKGREEEYHSPLLIVVGKKDELIG